MLRNIKRKLGHLKKDPLGLLFRRFVIYGNDLTRKILFKYYESKNPLNLKKRKEFINSFDKENQRFKVNERDGFRVFNPKDYMEFHSVKKDALEIVNKRNPENSRTNTKKQLLTGLLKDEDILAYSSFLDLALNEDVIRSVSKYLGCVPVLANMDVWYSKPTNDEPSDSALFHCDFDSIKSIKLFVYVNETTIDNGCLFLIDAENSKRLRKKINYHYWNKIADEVVEKYVPNESVIPVTGIPGTAAFIDTSQCFHYGSRVLDRSSHRVLAIFQYVSPASFIFKRFGRTYSNFSRNHHTQLQKMVLGLDN